MSEAESSNSHKGRPIMGAERHTLAMTLMRRYVAGESIRSLAASTNRSYGWIHRLLTESGVRFRPRGGARPRKQHP